MEQHEIDAYGIALRLGAGLPVPPPRIGRDRIFYAPAGLGYGEVARIMHGRVMISQPQYLHCLSRDELVALMETVAPQFLV